MARRPSNRVPVAQGGARDNPSESKSAHPWRTRFGTVMRAISRRWAALAFFGAALCACAEPRAPAGRWEGIYTDGGLLVVVRLEIASDGAVRVSAPNAITEGAALPDADRAR